MTSILPSGDDAKARLAGEASDLEVLTDRMAKKFGIRRDDPLAWPIVVTFSANLFLLMGSSLQSALDCFDADGGIRALPMSHSRMSQHAKALRDMTQALGQLSALAYGASRVGEGKPDRLPNPLDHLDAGNRGDTARRITRGG